MNTITRRLILVLACFSLSGQALDQTGLSIKLVPWIKTGLKAPTGIFFEPGNSSRVYILEQKGQILTWEKGQFAKEPFLDLQSKVTFGGERGLLGLAFHPQYQQNGRFFVNYTSGNSQLTSFVSEFKRGSLNEKIILKFAQPYSNHNGGHLAFDKAGLLYIGTGDGGSAGDPQNNGQRLDTFLGKILRINIDGQSPYEIPKDNPLQKTGEKKEIFAWGLRNPWRFSFDRETGALFAGDVGQDRYEEIDLVEKGKNYGWKAMEGDHCFIPGCNREGLVAPLVEYGRNDGGSVTGGFVYRGNKIPKLKGLYIYGDFMSGNVWALQYDQDSRKVIGNQLLLKTDVSIASFGEDPEGELYVVGYSGTIFRISPVL